MINERYHSRLFASESKAVDADIAGFLNSVDNPTLSEATRLDLNSDFTSEETENTIEPYKVQVLHTY